MLGSMFIEMVGNGRGGVGQGGGERCEGPTQAISVTYFTASLFGTGVFAGEVLYLYGQYQDSWVRDASSGWRIGRRNAVYMVSPPL